jgi:tetratricopeptide (TPR) repeat protein
MGDAYVGLSDDLSALYFDPAGLSGLAGSHLALQHNSYLAGTFQETLLYGFPLDGQDGMALGFNYVHWGTLDLRDTNGVTQGTYDDADMALMAGWGREWAKGFSAGLTLKALQQKIVDKLYNEVSASFGLLWAPVEGLRLGASYSNLGTDIGGNALAQELEAGGSYRWGFEKGKDILFSFSGDWQPNGISRLKGGLEGGLDRTFYIRAGYDIPLDGQIAGGGTAYSLGAGLRWKDLSLDYAFVPYGDFGVSHCLTLGYEFPQPTPAVLQVPVTVIQKVPAPTPVPTVAPMEPGKSAVQIKFKIPSGEEGVLSPSQEESRIQEQLGLIKVTPEDPNPWWQLGNLYYKQGRKEAAIQCFEQVLRLRPANETLKNWLEQYKAAKP